MTVKEKLSTAAIAVNNEEYNAIANILADSQESLVSAWAKEQLARGGRQQGKIKEVELKQQCKEFVQYLQKALQNENTNINSEEWKPVRQLLTDVSRSRTEQGFTPSETAMFVFSLKRTLFSQLRANLAKNPIILADATIAANDILDTLGLFTTEVFQKTREEVINRQQQEMLELSTPVVSLADGILALPLIGTLDSARTQVVMESLLQTIVTTGSTVAIIDITGVPTVDTLVAQHLLKTVTAARLMGADCIISGIRPQIAQTIVHLGVELGNVTTKASLAAAFKNALDRRGLAITRVTATGVKVLEKQ